ncbi:hypothetical protein N7540_000769 [Penicillium herquei]|nr:hypothetical protein N7540_000769 [Penicillium herquei]
MNAEACQLVKYGIDIHVIPHGVSIFALTLKNAGRMLGNTKIHLIPLSKVIDFALGIAHQAQWILIDMETMVNRDYDEPEKATVTASSPRCSQGTAAILGISGACENGGWGGSTSGLT